MFDLFYEGIVETALDLSVGAPQLPHYRRAPLRIDDGAPHRFASPRDYYRSLYFLFNCTDYIINLGANIFSNETFAYLHSTMTEKRLNDCILHIHKDLTDQLNITNTANESISANSDCHRYFGSFLA